MVLQAAFFAVSQIIPLHDAISWSMKDAAYKTYFAKGDEVVARNQAAIDRGAASVRCIRVPDSLGTGSGHAQVRRRWPRSRRWCEKYFASPSTAQKGDDLPVSAFSGYEGRRH